MISTLPPDADARHRFLCLDDETRNARLALAEWVTKGTEQDGIAVDGNDGDYSTSSSAYPRPGKPTEKPTDATDADEVASDLLQRLWNSEEVEPQILEQLQSIVSEAYTNSQCLEVILESILDADESVVDPELVAQLAALLRPVPKKYWTRSTRTMARYLARLSR